jgi:hypothetical protein
MYDDYPVKQLAYQTILGAAVEFANADTRKPYYLGGDIFHTPNTFDHLELRYDPDLVKYAIQDAIARHGEVRSEEEIYRLLVEIVRDAVAEAIKHDRESAEAFSALIVHQTRNQTSPESWF